MRLSSSYMYHENRQRNCKERLLQCLVGKNTFSHSSLGTGKSTGELSFPVHQESMHRRGQDLFAADQSVQPVLAVGQWSCACRRAGSQQVAPRARQVDICSA